MREADGNERRILVIVPFALDEAALDARSEQAADYTARRSVSFVFRPVRVGPTSFVGGHDWLLADLGVFEAGCQAQEEGFDAVCVDTMSDSGVSALRSVLDIPVVGPGRNALLLAITLGARFSILALWHPSVVRYRAAIGDLHLERHCASIRSLGFEPDFVGLLRGKEKAARDRLLEVGRQCVADDGADVIVLGSTTLHAAAKWLIDDLGIPVVNPGPASYAMAELLIDTGLSQSRKCYLKTPAPKLEVYRAMADAAAQVGGALPASGHGEGEG